MFSLIISIVAIALVVALIIATMFHGGDIMSKGSFETQVAQHINDMNQISAAATAYNVMNGVQPTKLSQLVPSYLATIPDGWSPDAGLTGFEASKLTTGTAATQLSVCQAINERMGFSDTTPPDCTSIPQNFNGCCVVNN